MDIRGRGHWSDIPSNSFATDNTITPGSRMVKGIKPPHNHSMEVTIIDSATHDMIVRWLYILHLQSPNATVELVERMRRNFQQVTTPHYSAPTRLFFLKQQYGFNLPPFIKKPRRNPENPMLTLSSSKGVKSRAGNRMLA